MMSPNEQTKILLDSDVVRHFLHADQLDKLPRIFPNRLVMLDKVKNELCRSKKLTEPVNHFLTQHKISVLPFPSNKEIIMEYAYLTRRFGEGESACMAVAKHQKQYIASSNLNDIREFCLKHNITYYTTMDILVEAIQREILTKDESNQFIQQVKAAGSKLPCENMDEYLKLTLSLSKIHS